MKIYRTSTQTEDVTLGMSPFQFTTVLDDEGNEPPPTARLVDVDEARKELLEALAGEETDTFINDEEAVGFKLDFLLWPSEAARAAIRRLFPEGE